MFSLYGAAKHSLRASKYGVCRQ